MVFRHTIDASSYVFDDLRDLLAKATPARSGDRLAGIAAGSAEEMVAARMALAEVPLTQFLQETVIPYEDDEVTRLIVDGHDAGGWPPPPKSPQDPFPPRGRQELPHYRVDPRRAGLCPDRLANRRRIPRLSAL